MTTSPQESPRATREVRERMTFDELLNRYGPAGRARSAPVHQRPEGLDDATVDALGQLSAALETAEDARGHLYAFHRLSGRADLDLQSALDAFRAAGHEDVADRVAEVLVGRNVITDRWTFEIVEDYDANYLSAFRAAEQAARNAFGVGPHLAEAEMKVREQTKQD
jgi:hypothetical protein